MADIFLIEFLTIVISIFIGLPSLLYILSKKFFFKEPFSESLHFLSDLDDNFYYKNLNKKVEIFTLKLGQVKFYSLVEFLDNFKEGERLIKNINNSITNKTPIRYFIVLNSRNNYFKFIAKINICKTNKLNYILVYFIDHSQLSRKLYNLKQEYSQMSVKLKELQRIIDISPFIIYAKTPEYIASNKLYKRCKEYIEADCSKKNLKLGNKYFQLRNVIYGNNHYLFGFEITGLAQHKNLEYNNYFLKLSGVLNLLSEPIIIINKKLEIILQNHSFQRIWSKSYLELLDYNGNADQKHNHVNSVNNLITDMIVLQLQISDAKFNTFYIPSAYIGDDTIVIFKKLEKTVEGMAEEKGFEPLLR